MADRRTTEQEEQWSIDLLEMFQAVHLMFLLLVESAPAAVKDGPIYQQMLQTCDAIGKVSTVETQRTLRLIKKNGKKG